MVDDVVRAVSVGGVCVCVGNGGGASAWKACVWGVRETRLDEGSGMTAAGDNASSNSAGTETERVR